MLHGGVEMGPIEAKALILSGAIIAGIFCIFIGYRLYVIGVIEKGSGSASSGGVTLSWRDYGPGVVFALFGAGLIIFAILRPMSQQTQHTLRTLNPAPTSQPVAVGPQHAPAPAQTPLTVSEETVATAESANARLPAGGALTAEDALARSND